MRVIKIVLLFWTNENVWKKFSKPLLKMIGDHSAFRIALRKLPSTLRAVQKPTICHFKENFIITNLSKCLEVLRPKILPPDLKTSGNFFLVHPLVDF